MTVDELRKAMNAGLLTFEEAKEHLVTCIAWDLRMLQIQEDLARATGVRNMKEAGGAD